MVEFWPDASSASANSVDGEPTPSRGDSSSIGVLDFGDLGLAGVVEGGGGQDQDGGVDEQGKHQRDGAVDGGQA